MPPVMVGRTTARTLSASGETTVKATARRISERWERPTERSPQERRRLPVDAPRGLAGQLVPKTPGTGVTPTERAHATWSLLHFLARTMLGADPYRTARLSSPRGERSGSFAIRSTYRPALATRSGPAAR